MCLKELYKGPQSVLCASKSLHKASTNLAKPPINTTRNKTAVVIFFGKVRFQRSRTLMEHTA